LEAEVFVISPELLAAIQKLGTNQLIELNAALGQWHASNDVRHFEQELRPLPGREELLRRIMEEEVPTVDEMLKDAEAASDETTSYIGWSAILVCR
jgi:hypothetical protein